MNKYDDCPYLLKDFLFYLETIKGNSKKTVNGYHIDLRTFFRFLLKYQFEKSDKPFEEIVIKNIDLDIIKKINISNVYEFLHYIANDRNNNPVTRSRKISSIRSFFNYLHIKIKVIDDNPVKELSLPSTKKSLPKYLSLEQSIELLQYTDKNLSKRDFCILTLFLNCGMRLSELVSINTYDIKENKLKLLGKGN
ncbi:MAG: recombinase XerC, partial [Oscillospiraceae bacterium]